MGKINFFQKEKKLFHLNKLKATLYEPVQNGFHDQSRKKYPIWETSKNHLLVNSKKWKNRVKWASNR